jgi:Transglutaminase-like superfamily
MFRNSTGYTEGEAPPVMGEARLRWLRGTRQLDVMAPKLRTQTLSLTQLLHSDREKAVALHNFVQNLPFGCVADYSELTADGVLKQGSGDCFTKGLLFVAMLRCAGIPARLRFVSLPVHFLRGIIEPEEASIMHAMTEMLIDNRWLVTDTYVPDPVLFSAASKKLGAENRVLGYGIHVAGTQVWHALKDASAQCVVSDPSSLPVVDWGVSHDPETFYADPSHTKLRRSFASRVKWRLASPMVNKRVAALRASL